MHHSAGDDYHGTQVLRSMLEQSTHSNKPLDMMHSTIQYTLLWVGGASWAADCTDDSVLSQLALAEKRATSGLNHPLGRYLDSQGVAGVCVKDEFNSSQPADLH